MDQKLLEDTIHELTCRDRYALTSANVGMTIRDVYPDIPEAEVVAEMWGEHAPPDLACMLVMEVGGRSDLVIAVPLGAAEAARWQAAAASMWSALSAADPEVDEQASPGAGR